MSASWTAPSGSSWLPSTVSDRAKASGSGVVDRPSTVVRATATAAAAQSLKDWQRALATSNSPCAVSPGTLGGGGLVQKGTPSSIPGEPGGAHRGKGPLLR